MVGSTYWHKHLFAYAVEDRNFLQQLTAQMTVARLEVGKFGKTVEISHPEPPLPPFDHAAGT
jgi:hypothetical protein